MKKKKKNKRKKVDSAYGIKIIAEKDIPELRLAKSPKIQVRYRELPKVVKGKIKGGKFISEKKALTGKVFYRIELWRYFYSAHSSRKFWDSKKYKNSKRRITEKQILKNLRKVHAKWTNPPVMMIDPKTGKATLVIMSP